MEIEGFKNMRIRIKDAIHSIQVQEALFHMGYYWVENGQHAICTSSKFLITHDSGAITSSGSRGLFLHYPEHKLVMVPGFVAEPESITIEGKTFLKSQVEEALKGLLYWEE